MDKPLVRNAADETQVKAATQKQKTDEQRLQDDFLMVLDSEQGRRILWHIMEHCNPLDMRWRPDSETQYHNGKKSVAAWLTKEITSASPRAYLLMQKEAGELKNV